MPNLVEKPSRLLHLSGGLCGVYLEKKDSNDDKLHEHWRQQLQALVVPKYTANNVMFLLRALAITMRRTTPSCRGRTTRRSGTGAHPPSWPWKEGGQRRLPTVSVAAAAGAAGENSRQQRVHPTVITQHTRLQASFITYQSQKHWRHSNTVFTLIAITTHL